MQCVSGMHYNFSIKPSSLSIFNGSSDQKNIDSAYLGLIRNFKRLFWFVLSEFGQTNVVDKSFIKNREHILKELNEEDMYLKNATSLRMSEIGYQSKAQKDLGIKYNSLSGFLEKIIVAINCSSYFSRTASVIIYIHFGCKLVLGNVQEKTQYLVLYRWSKLKILFTTSKIFFDFSLK